jgi:hypothetical protein
VFEVGLLGMSIHIGTSPHPWAEGIRKALGKDLPRFLEVTSVVDDKHYIGHAPGCLADSGILPLRVRRTWPACMSLRELRPALAASALELHCQSIRFAEARLKPRAS